MFTSKKKKKKVLYKPENLKVSQKKLPLEKKIAILIKQI